MTLGGWLLAIGASLLVAFAALVIRVTTGRDATRLLLAGTALAVTAMALRPDLWPWLYGGAMAVALILLAAWLVAAMTADVQAWKERRR